MTNYITFTELTLRVWSCTTSRSRTRTRTHPPPRATATDSVPIIFRLQAARQLSSSIAEVAVTELAGRGPAGGS